MKIYGFWYSHIGWIVGPDFKETDFKTIGDYAKYPELVWLNKHYLVAPTMLALTIMALGGWVNGGSVTAMFTTAGFSSLFIGFFQHGNPLPRYIFNQFHHAQVRQAPLRDW